MGMETVVAFLIGWAVNRAQRFGQRAGARADQAVDAAVDHAWRIIGTKLGAHPAIARLRSEAAQNGSVSAAARSESERVLQAAAEHDPQFGNSLRGAVLEAMNRSARLHADAVPASVRNSGNYVGPFNAGGPVKITQKSKVMNYAQRHPVPFTAIVFVLVCLLSWGGYVGGKIVFASDPGDSTPGLTSTGSGLLATGSDTACGVRPDHTVVCWGEGGEFLRPSGQFTSVAVNRDLGCGLRQDKSVTCWDASAGHTTTGPSPTPRPEATTSSPSGQFLALAAGCGVRLSGEIECWVKAPQPPVGKFTAITIGQYSVSCALRVDKSVACWGDSDDEVNKDGGPIRLFTAISVGGYHACGLRENHTVTCWGKNDEGQASAPPGTFTTVTTGEEHSCGLRTDQTVTCWGRAKGGQTSPPEGPFAVLGVGTGGEFSCGTRPNGTVECWGRDGKLASGSPDRILVR